MFVISISVSWAFGEKHLRACFHGIFFSLTCATCHLISSGRRRIPGSFSAAPTPPSSPARKAWSSSHCSCASPRVLPRWHNGKEPAGRCRRCKRRRFDPWVGKIPWSRKWQPTAVFLPEKSRGQRSWAGCSPKGHKELDTLNINLTLCLYYNSKWFPHWICRKDSYLLFPIHPMEK